MALPLGSFVEIQGLEKAPVYNGIAGLIVKPKNDQERYGVQLLDHAEGWKEESLSFSIRKGLAKENKKLEVGGNIIAVKEVNLKKTNRDSQYWRIAESDGTSRSILERVRSDPKLANIDRCDELAQGIWNCFFETMPGEPLTLDDGLYKRKAIMNDAKGHVLFWLALDAIQHHLIIEKCRGRYRVMQSFVDEAPIMPGYMAKEWCGMENTRLLSTEVHKTYGGGRTVGDTEISRLLDYIKDLQSLTKKLLPHLLKNAPGLDQSAIDLIKGGPNGLSPEEMNLASEKLHEAASWTHEIEKRMEGPLGLTTLNVFFDDPENIKVLDDPVYIIQGDNVVFQIPKRLYLRVHELNYNLTGQIYLNMAVFVRMISMGAWWEHRRGEDDGGIGFTIRQAAL